MPNALMRNVYMRNVLPPWCSRWDEFPPNLVLGAPTGDYFSVAVVNLQHLVDTHFGESVRCTLEGYGIFRMQLGDSSSAGEDPAKCCQKGRHD